ncbi:camphor resistance protein CrcB [Streptomyces sp. yr375]|uniref:fluoride efflux transporter CrcB n=1 Tax=Streptomyces sp. yr375 TaxID=1761906 RepID=UPI0008CE8F7D|nr:fluoride efflux transporter CrcB [Streptomyces sp. yr375]SER49855.1 camphor resistance protein CrcB [Streptomyces sp. yr375]
MNWLVVVVGGMIGAPLRYLTDRTVQARHDSVFPWGTFVVNITGCLILGTLTGAADITPDLRLFLGTGLCGALTTYSTFSYETLRLTETGAGLYAAANAAASVVVGLGAAFAGVAIGQTVWA